MDIDLLFEKFCFGFGVDISMAQPLQSKEYKACKAYLEAGKMQVNDAYQWEGT